MTEAPGRIAVRVIAFSCRGRGRGFDCRQTESRGNDGPSRQCVGHAAGRGDGRVETPQLQPIRRARRRANPDVLTARRDKPRQVRAQRVVAGGKLVEREASLHVGDRHRHRRAEQRHHRARERSASIVADDAGDRAADDGGIHRHRAELGERADTALTTDCASAGEAAAITVPATAAESTHFHLSARNPRAGSPAVTRPMALLRSGYEPTTVNVTSRDTVFRETMSVTVMPSRYSPS